MWQENQSIIQKLVTGKSLSLNLSTEGIKVATISQAKDLARFYQSIFKVYPTPLHEESHIIKTMQEGTVYAYIESDHQLVSAASGTPAVRLHRPRRYRSGGRNRRNDRVAE